MQNASKLIDGVLHTSDSIVRQYSNLVYKHARNLCRSDYHYMEDLAQEGFIGLLDAFDRFDPDNGNSFMTYAYQYVRGYMLRLHDKSNIFYVPHHVIRLAWSIERKEIWDKSDERISEIEGETVNAVAGARIYFSSRNHTSLDKVVRENENDASALYNFQIYEQDFSSVLSADMTRKLNPREKMIVYKLSQGYKQSEIAPAFGISRTRVGQILKGIQAKLQKEIC